jgi:HK97 family phage major capsid protein
MTLQEMREKRAKAIADARALMDTAKKANRDLSDDETRQVDAAFAESDRLKDEIKAAEAKEARQARLEREERELEESRGRRAGGETPGRDPAGPREEPRDTRGAQPGRVHRWELRRRGSRDVAEFRYLPGSAEHRRHTPEYREAFRSVLVGEQRALQSDIDVQGGFLVAPEEWVGELLKDLDDQVFIRSKARLFTTSAQSIGAPRRTAKTATFAWGGELTTPTADTSLRFGKRSLSPHYMTGLVPVSRDLLRSSVMSAESIVRQEIARDAAELEEQGFISGSGAGQPLGLFTASSDGISTSRDVSTGNNTTAPTVDGLIAAKFHLKQMYRRTAEWMFHRTLIALIRKLKDGNGQYLWQPSVVAGEPDRLLDMPVNESEWIPSTLTTGQYVGILGAFNYYWIVDGLDLGMQVLQETYALQNQIAYLVRRKVDGGPAVEEAFARVKLA